MPRKILIIDDEKPLRAMLRSFFESKECEVIEAADVSEALEAAVRDQPTAITLDFKMASYGDGSDIFTELKRDKRTASIPVVIYSGMTEEEIKAAFPLSEQLRFVLKPGNLDQIMIAIEELSD